MENYEPNIHKQVKLNPNHNNSESSESNHNSEPSEFDNSFEEFDLADLMDNLIRDLSNGERFAITDFIVGLGLTRNIDFNRIVNDDFVAEHPLSRDLFEANNGIPRSIAESISFIMQENARLNIQNNQNIQINDNLTTTNLNFMLQAIQRRLEEGVPLNNLAIINNWGYPSNEDTEQLLVNIASLPNRPRSLSILNSDINANNLINYAFNNVPAVPMEQRLLINANVNNDLFIRHIDPANANLNIHIGREDINDFIVNDQANRRIPNLQEITQTLHEALIDDDNESAIYDYIQALHNIDPAIPLVVYPELINLNNYPNLATIILDSVRNEGGELIINENNLTANSTNLILQGILGGLNAENPQFQGLQSLQISSNALNGDDAGMNEESMNLLSTILLHPNNQITQLDIRNNNINPDHLNIFLGRIANNQNLRELDFSNNFINQASVGLLNRILGNNLNINIDADYCITRGIELGNLANHPGFYHGLELQVPVNQFATPSTSPGRSRASSLGSLNSNL